MKRSNVLLTSGTLFVVAVVGCQAIAGIQAWPSDPEPPAGACNLPQSGAGLVRLVNAANVRNASGSTAADFCIKQSGTIDWGRPVFRDGGQDALCSGGLPYLQATVPFHVPVGSIDVKAIPAGKTCAAPATSEKDGIPIAAAGPDPTAPLEVTTLLRYAGGTTREAIAALPEEPGQISGDSSNVRVVNALSGGASINFGVPPSKATSLPTVLEQPLFAAPIPPGGTAPKQTVTEGPVDGEGYLKTLNTGFTYVASLANDATDTAVMFLQLPQTAAITASVFVVGDPSSKNSFPVRGLYCQDRLSLASAATGTAPSGFTKADVAELEDCTLTALPTLSFDAWDLALTGQNSPFPAAREPYIDNAIAARTSTDVFCVTEADGIADRQQIIQKATQFPYSYEIDTTTATQPDDPTQEDGGIPAAPTGPACGPPVSAAQVAKVYSCVARNCAGLSDDGGVGPLVQNTSCIASSCVLEFSQLYFPNQATPLQTADDVCFNCMVLNVLDPTETLPEGQAICTGSSAPVFMYGGQTPLLILSKYPFNSKKAYIFPSTGIQRGILKVQVQLEGDLAVDVFCTQLASPQLDSSLPYVGSYGRDTAPVDGGPGENGWADEQGLQAKRAVSWIRSEVERDGVPAVVMGTFYSTIGVTASGGDAGISLASGTLSPGVMQTLDDSEDGGAFLRAEPYAYARACDTCPENAYTPGHAPLEFQPMFLLGFPAGQVWVASETLWATDNGVVPLTSTQFETAPPGNTGPLSTYYAHNWQIFRPPPGPGAGDAGVDAGGP